MGRKRVASEQEHCCSCCKELDRIAEAMELEHIVEAMELEHIAEALELEHIVEKCTDLDIVVLDTVELEVADNCIGPVGVEHTAHLGESHHIHGCLVEVA